MTLIESLIIILFVHYVADFLLQTRQMATKKSTSIGWLTAHVFVYASVTTLLWRFLFVDAAIATTTVWIYNITFVTHWVTDFFTSKLSGFYYQKKNYYMFFNVIGMDQIIHYICLFYTYKTLII